MKLILRYNNFPRGILIYFILALAGCAGQVPFSKNGMLDTSGSNVEIATISANSPAFSNTILTDKTGEYQHISTAFDSEKQGIAKSELKSAVTGRHVTGQIKEKEADLQNNQEDAGEVHLKNREQVIVPKQVLSQTVTLPAHKDNQQINSSSSSQETESVVPLPNKNGIVLNFDNADLYEVIKTFAEILQFNYLVDPGINGKVTIQTAGYLKKKDLFAVFLQILEVNGLTAIQEGALYRIIKIKDAPRMPIISNQINTAKQLLSGEKYIIQIIPLQFISTQEMTKLLIPFISEGGTLVDHQGANTLIIVDKEINILKILRLVHLFDINIFEKVNYRFYPLKYITVKDTEGVIDKILTFYGYTENDVSIVPIERINTLLILSSKPELFDKTETFISQIDVAGDDIESRIHVYPVKNGEASELAVLLNTVFGKSDDSQDKSDKRIDEKGKDYKRLFPETPFNKKDKLSEKKIVGQQGGKQDTVGSGTLKGEIRITADKIRNMLIIEAIPFDYRIIETILKRLDVLPRQVLVEATIAEITLNNKMELGVEWTYFKGKDTLSTSLLSASAGSAGLKYLIGKTDRWTNTLVALASESKVNILSSPSVLASDNKEATINITTEIPVQSTTYYYPDDSDSIIPSTIEYRNTGIILTVTPHINEFGLVSMDINQEVSEQAGDVAVGKDETAASFFKRSVSTSLTVLDGQTIVIGGLIRETKSKDDSGLPFIRRIPFLKYLFGKKTDTVDKTELIILITPRVIANLDDIDVVTSEFKSKIQDVITNIAMPFK